MKVKKGFGGGDKGKDKFVWEEVKRIQAPPRV